MKEMELLREHCEQLGIGLPSTMRSVKEERGAVKMAPPAVDTANRKIIHPNLAL